MLRACRRTFCRQPETSRAIGLAGAAIGFSSTCPAPRISHRWPGVWRNEQTYRRHAESRTKVEERGYMSSQNGDKARFNRLRKQKFRRRELMARLATQSAPSAARLGKTPPAKLEQR